MARRWHNLEILKDMRDESNWIYVFKGVQYNDRDYAVYVYHWPEEWQWKSPKGTNYKSYKVDQWKAANRKEWRTKAGKWFEGSFRRGN